MGKRSNSVSVSAKAKNSLSGEHYDILTYERDQSGLDKSQVYIPATPTGNHLILPVIDEMREDIDRAYEMSSNNYEFSPQVWIHSQRGDSAAQ
jgi:hypothetical protein